MGDRGNIVIRSEQGTNQGDVWLYTHYRGSDMKTIIQEVLARFSHWEDAEYLARMIFCHLVGIEGLCGDMGYGIGTRMCDNEHGILVVDVPNRKVVRIGEELLVGLRLPAYLNYRVSRTFTEYAEHGFKKRLPVERRVVKGVTTRRFWNARGLLGGRRYNNGRRKGDA